MTSLNGHYIRQAEDVKLIDLIMPSLTESLNGNLAGDTAGRLEKGMSGLKERAKTLGELSENAEIYARTRPLALDEKAARLLQDDGKQHLGLLRPRLDALGEWNLEGLEKAIRDYAENAGIKLSKAAQPLRAVLTGRTVSPGIFEVMEILGRDETLGRLDDALSGKNKL